MLINNNITDIPHLFDRGMPSKHPWQVGMVSLQESVLVAERAVHGNLAMDHRVGAANQGWLIQTQPTVSIKDLHAYFTAQCCVPAPKFLGKPVTLAPATELIHVQSLWQMLKRVVMSGDGRELLNDFFASQGLGKLIPTVSRDMTEVSTIDQIAETLNSLPEDIFREAIELFQNLLGNTSPHWWTTLVREVERQTGLQDGPALLRLLGIGQCDAQDWLLVYRYRASDVSLFYQPTTLESRAYPFHFPSPPGVDAGLTMPLDPQNNPCLEYIHRPLSADISAQRVLHPLLPLHTVGSANKEENYQALGTYRQAQRQKLKRISQPASDWVDRHSHLF